MPPKTSKRAFFFGQDTPAAESSNGRSSRYARCCVSTLCALLVSRATTETSYFCLRYPRHCKYMLFRCERCIPLHGVRKKNRLIFYQPRNRSSARHHGRLLLLYHFLCPTTLAVFFYIRSGFGWHWRNESPRCFHRCNSRDKQWTPNLPTTINTNRCRKKAAPVGGVGGGGSLCSLYKSLWVNAST